MSWHHGRLAAFDTETTGVDLESSRIVTAAIRLLGDDQPTTAHDWLVDPGVEIPAGATAVHGITTERARADGQDAASAIGEIIDTLASLTGDGVPIVVFNARFDLTILDREAGRYEIDSFATRVGGADAMLVIDPLVVDKQVDRYRRGKRRLEDVCAHYGVSLDGAHDAGADAVAGARVAWQIAEHYPEVGAMSLRELHDAQVDWAAAQAASLEEYFRGKGRNEIVERAWPVVPHPA